MCGEEKVKLTEYDGRKERATNFVFRIYVYMFIVNTNKLPRPYNSVLAPAYIFLKRHRLMCATFCEFDEFPKTFLPLRF